MNIATRGAWFPAVLAAAVLCFASSAGAQGAATPQPGGSGGVTNQTTMGAGGGLGDSLAYGTVGHQQERDEFAAFQSFSKETDSAKKIQKGREFLKKYPKSRFEEPIDAALADTYRTQADWTDEYRYADLALALDPDDVDVLASVGWTIPHAFDPKSPDANDQLDKAQKYALHAIDVLATLPKPAGKTDEQFATAKAWRTYQAHSALGLVYFRRNDYESSEKELAQAVGANAKLDQTDFYVLGMDRAHLSQFSEAADAFHACAAIAGPLQGPCSKNAAVAANQAASPKSQ